MVREEAGRGITTYNLDPNSSIVLISNEHIEGEVSINVLPLANKAQRIFEEMKNSNASSFSIELANEVMTELYCSQLKASSSKKADLHLKLYSHEDPDIPDIGFSVKSSLGSPSTLLNASSGTNFTFKLSKNVDIETVNCINTSSKIKDRITKLKEDGASLELYKVDSEIFEDNLLKVHENLPLALSLIVKKYYETGFKTISDLTSQLISDNDFPINIDFAPIIKKFLMAITLSMMPKSPWGGLTPDEGGIIIVKDDGDVVCFHLYESSNLENYIFDNTKLDTPSSSRHNFGYIYEENGSQFMKLNLQIRFLR